MQIDSLNIQTDSVSTRSVDTTSLTQPANIQLDRPSDSAVAVQTIIQRQPILPEIKNEPTASLPIENVDSLLLDSIMRNQESVNPFKPFIHSQNRDSSKVTVGTNTLTIFRTEQPPKQLISETRNPIRVFEKEWTFGISVFITLLIIVLRIYYEKYLQSVISSALNIQLAEKLMREKNVLIKRGNWLLNICFVFALGLYLYITAERITLSIPLQNAFFRYIYLVAIVTGVLIIRLILVRLTAYIFDSIPVYREYLHNSFIINKNLGLYIMPLMAVYFFVPPIIGHTAYIAATVIIFLSIIFRYFKALQIIFKHNIFLFYSILYLCTLEILPALVGIKFVLTLR